MNRTLFGGLGALVASVLVASCSSTTNYREAAVKAIEGNVQNQLGMGDLQASCQEPSSKEVGTTFDCTADTESGDTITLTAEITSKDRVSVQTTNVLTPDNLAKIEAEAARILSEKVGQELPAESIDCGSQPVVAEAGKPIVCALSSPSDPTLVYDTSITLDNLVNPTHLDVEVASQPRA